MEINSKSIYRQVFDAITECLSINRFDPIVLERTPEELASSVFPLVIVELADRYHVQENLCHKDQMFANIIEVNIYTKDQTFNGGRYGRKEIADEISDYIEFSTNNQDLSLKMTSCQPMPNIDKSVYRIRMMFRCLYRLDTNVIYKR